MDKALRWTKSCVRQNPVLDKILLDKILCWRNRRSGPRTIGFLRLLQKPSSNASYQSSVYRHMSCPVATTTSDLQKPGNYSITIECELITNHLPLPGRLSWITAQSSSFLGNRAFPFNCLMNSIASFRLGSVGWSRNGLELRIIF